eukprot:1494651-Alexandrium_andersonii.AAC.1
MDTPSTATFGAGSGTSSDPARGPPRAAPAVVETEEAAGGPPSVNALTALSVVAEAVSAISVPAPVAVAVNQGGSTETGAPRTPRVGDKSAQGSGSRHASPRSAFSHLPSHASGRSASQRSQRRAMAAA